ncbi:hypothetical protein GLOTRDRAFT_127499 [Gloeophyllum trabeum ATCC 11539]|uniref:Uncharacterized protein n=1 Tax=Gloeophyllum trabeum (strain ATCC 11539 / FP-39264 / Madison 617) TaxID=670483 RepID=S7QB21_GLOTA|nr:uncharacterized protein GLOTRDRAFT_127499 [Gloeophyllum trabeum ATCC 11539]EPQ57126.1 hypothetical protein GLOTRDRAFT_127499 [Gloeophyllum trabeum ATCC 11539]
MILLPLVAIALAFQLLGNVNNLAHRPHRAPGLLRLGIDGRPGDVLIWAPAAIALVAGNIGRPSKDLKSSSVILPMDSVLYPIEDASVPQVFPTLEFYEYEPKLPVDDTPVRSSLTEPAVCTANFVYYYDESSIQDAEATSGLFNISVAAAEGPMEPMNGEEINADDEAIAEDEFEGLDGQQEQLGLLILLFIYLAALATEMSFLEGAGWLIGLLMVMVVVRVALFYIFSMDVIDDLMLKDRDEGWREYCETMLPQEGHVK